jgi:hypothetical protein
VNDRPKRGRSGPVSDKLYTNRYLSSFMIFDGVL